jgi:PAS domain S-box-containing protein
MPADHTSYKDKTRDELIFEINELKSRLLTLNEYITRSKTAEDSLRDSEERFRATFEQAAVGMTQVDLDGIIIRANQKFCDITGYSYDELIGSSISDITYPQDFPEEKKLIQRLLSGEINTFSIEKRYIRKDGSIIWVNLTVAILMKDGKPKNFIGVTQDITRRKQIEEALSKSEAFLKNIFDGIQDGISVLDKDLTIIRVNKTMERWHPDTVPLEGKKCYQAYHCRDEPCEYCPNLKAMKEKCTSVNLVPRDVEGKTVGWQEVYSFPLYDDNGNVIGVIDYVRDITPRKIAEDALKNSEAKFKAIFENAGAAIFIADVETGNIIECNTNAEQLVGRSRSELIGMHQTKLHPEDESEKYNKIFNLHAKIGSFKDIEGEVQHKDGRKIPVWINIQRLIIDGKENLISFFFNITDRKQAEEALRKSEEKFRVLAEMTNAGIVLYKGERLIYCNPALEKISGYSGEELLKMRFWDLIHPDFQDLVRGRGLARQSGASLPSQYEIKILTKDGEERWLELSAAMINYKEQQTGIATLYDITERKRSEAELQDAKAQSELYLDLMGHDINNMNQIALGFLELSMCTLKLNKEEKELLSRPIEALESSTKLIDNVRKLQKAREGGLKFHKINIEEMIRGIIPAYLNIGGRDIIINSKPGCNCLVMANDLLSDVFSNIIGNSIKHSSGSLEVNIHFNRITSDDTNYCMIVIEDNGPGIPDSLKRKLFNRFQMGSPKESGRGLGLYLVKTLVEDFHGKTWVEDRIKGDHTKGSKFVVMLPTVEK